MIITRDVKYSFHPWLASPSNGKPILNVISYGSPYRSTNCSVRKTQLSRSLERTRSLSECFVLILRSATKCLCRGAHFAFSRLYVMDPTSLAVTTAHIAISGETLSNVVIFGSGEPISVPPTPGNT